MGLKPHRIQRLEDYRSKSYFAEGCFFEIRLKACPDSPTPLRRPLARVGDLIAVLEREFDFDSGQCRHLPLC